MSGLYQSPPGRELTITLIDSYDGSDLTVRQSVGPSIENMTDAFKCFLLAAGYSPDNVKEYFSED